MNHEGQNTPNRFAYLRRFPRRINSKQVGILILFITTAVLNFMYGPLLYSEVLGMKVEYNIGQACAISRPACAQKYFQDDLNRIDTISNQPRTYFSGIIIQDDRVGYLENCPCPYNVDSRGYSCGGRSSYSKGGQISYCYDSDITDEQVVQLKNSILADAQQTLASAEQKDINVYQEPYTFLLVLLLYGFWFYGARKRDSFRS